MPNLDLRFFATAVILQRQTGGDLAEILDKIGYLVRERFKIWGQVQALTGEGRLSGIVLLALPPVLFLAVYRLNPDYVMPLFTDPLGKQMLLGGGGHAGPRRACDSQNHQHQGLAVSTWHLFSIATLLPLAIFGVVAVAAWVMLEYFGGRQSRAAERLDEIEQSPMPVAAKRRSTGKKGDAMTKVFEMASPALAKPLQAQERSRSQQAQEQALRRRLPQRLGSSIFLGLKFIGLMVGLLIGWHDDVRRPAASPSKRLIYTVGGSAAMFYLPDIVVVVHGQQPQEEHLPFACPTCST